MLGSEEEEILGGFLEEVESGSMAKGQAEAFFLP